MDDNTSSMAIILDLVYRDLVTGLTALLEAAWLLHTCHTLLSLALALHARQPVNWEGVRDNLSWCGLGGGLGVYCAKARVDQQPVLLEMVLSFVIVLVALLVIRLSKIQKNQHESTTVIENAGRDLARTTFSFLENVIKGKGPREPFDKILADHLKKERLEDVTFFPKLLVLFPEWRPEDQTKKHPFGSVKDIVVKEKEQGSSHCLARGKIAYSYVASGGMERTAQLEVLVWREGGRTTYLAFSENRALNSLQQMVDEPCIRFTRTDFQTQFTQYRAELVSLLEGDTGCRDR